MPCRKANPKSIEERLPEMFLRSLRPEAFVLCSNTSGFGAFWEAIYNAGDVQVINMTHEGSAIAAAAGYTWPARTWDSSSAAMLGYSMR
jgi:hypothetical protein